MPSDQPPNRTLELLSGRYWWPRMRADIQRYVMSCTACAKAKVSRTFPAGKLMPLPTPQRPWSHLSIDFITDLPKSDEMTTIVTIVDRFSKTLRLILLPSLPTAFSLAELLFTQIFRHYGIPEDMVSDRGPQFMSRVWAAFMDMLGITVSLTYGYHPRSNGQVE